MSKTRYKIVDVMFEVYGGGCEEVKWDETQFDIEDTGDFIGMTNELLGLVNDFADENANEGMFRIVSVREGWEE